MGAPRGPKGSRWPTILLIAGAGVVSAFQVGKAPTALAAVQADLALGLATASWLLSAFAIVGARAGIAIGVAVDHVGARRTVLAGLLLQGLFSAAGAFAEGAPLLLATRAIEGLGFLTVTVATPTLIVAVARPRDLGLAINGCFSGCRYRPCCRPALAGPPSTSGRSGALAMNGSTFPTRPSSTRRSCDFSSPDAEVDCDPR
jgi:MFS family permease